MEKRWVLIFAIASAIVSQHSCSRKDQNNVLTDLPDSESVVPFDSTFNVNWYSPVGEWKTAPFFLGSSKLTIEDDGGFTFHSFDCFGGTFTRGNWERQGRICVLTSLDEFKYRERNATIQRSTPIYFNKVPIEIICDSLYFQNSASVFAIQHEF
jgi:hypothetical protein